LSRRFWTFCPPKFCRGSPSKISVHVITPATSSLPWYVFALKIFWGPTTWFLVCAIWAKKSMWMDPNSHVLLSFKVHRTCFAERRKYRSRSRIFPILDVLSHFRYIRDQCRKLCKMGPNFAPKIWGGPTNFRLAFCIIKSTMILITWQSFAAIGRRSDYNIRPPGTVVPEGLTRSMGQSPTCGRPAPQVRLEIQFRGYMAYVTKLVS